MSILENVIVAVVSVLLILACIWFLVYCYKSWKVEDAKKKEIDLRIVKLEKEIEIAHKRISLLVKE